MSLVKHSTASRSDAVRLYKCLAERDVLAADKALDVIAKAIDYIGQYPLCGAPILGRAQLRYDAQADVSLVARILHQKEWYDPNTIGR